jgi:hypothetical protein
METLRHAVDSMLADVANHAMLLRYSLIPLEYITIFLSFSSKVANRDFFRLRINSGLNSDRLQPYTNQRTYST